MECPYPDGMILAVFAHLSLIPDAEDINNTRLRLAAPSQPSVLQDVLLKAQCLCNAVLNSRQLLLREIKTHWEMSNGGTVVIIQLSRQCGLFA